MEPLGALEQLIAIAHGGGTAQERLREILKVLSSDLGFDAAVLYWIDKEGQFLRAWQGSLGRDFVAHSEPFRPGEGVVGTCCLEGRVLLLQKGQHLDPRKRIWAQEFPAYSTILAVPAKEQGAPAQGVLLMLHGTFKEVSQEELRLLSLVGQELASLVAREEVRDHLQLRIQELEALNEISRAASSTLDLEPLMDLTIETAVRVMGARAGVLRVLDEEAQLYKVTSVAGGRISHKEEFRSGLQSDCPVVRTGEPQRMADREGAALCSGEGLDIEVKTCACVPLAERGKILGVLSLYDRGSRSGGEPEPFSEQDVNLLQTMAGFIAGAVSRAIHHSRIERLVMEQESVVRELSILYSSGSAMMRAMDMDSLLRVVLVALTLGDGLGFNRAMLFLVNEEEGVIEGKVGVGPANADEAGRIWKEVSGSKWGLGKWLDWALSQEAKSLEPTLIQRVAQSVRVSLDDEECVLVKALKAKGPFCLDPRESPRGIEMLVPLETGVQCALAPVVARGESLGVILVDNLYSGRVIAERDLRFLGAFCSLAGLAIQNALFFEGLRKAHKELRSMQQRLIQSEKLAALGEFAATMAHEIRNPLVSIGGYARLLQRRHRDEYSKIIYEEVERLEGILSRVLDFSKISPGPRSETDLGALLEDCYRSVRPQVDEQRLRVFKEWTGGLPPIQCDRDQLKQVFLNLMQNAMDAMAGKGTLGLKTYLSSDEDGIWVVAEISDTGGGISADVLPNIFNPFFTTKERGTGLGLAVTRRIVEMHGGRIEVDNRPGKGTTFRVKLPPSF